MKDFKIGNIKTYITQFKNQFALSGVITFAIGMLLLIWPALTGKALCWLLAGVLITKGATGIISRYRMGGAILPFEMMGSAISLLTGLYVGLRSDVIISIIPFVCGLFLLISGISGLQNAFAMKNMNYPGWNHGLIFTVIKVVLAGIIVMNPFGTAMTLTRFIGGCLVYDGAAGLITVYESAKARNAFDKAQNDLRDLNLKKEEQSDHIPVVEAEFVEVIKEVREEKE
ncbi:MAG: DUF308 domain-containing protein [Oscillospiraceae bacterium]|nr:DUF308 domain-containing protein [Oscillospiraceae bacterium]